MAEFKPFSLGDVVRDVQPLVQMQQQAATIEESRLARAQQVEQAAYKRQQDQFAQEQKRVDGALSALRLLKESPQLLQNADAKQFFAQQTGEGWFTDLSPENFDSATDALQRRKLLADVAKAELEVKLGPRAATDLGKLNEDFARGKISKPDYIAARDKLFGPDSDKLFANAGKLRGEFDKQSQNFNAIRDAYRQIAVSAEDPSGAGDLSMIFSYMKLLDPGSTVREGEQASAQQAAGVPSRILALYNSLVTGEKLAPEQRRDFVDRARRLYDSAVEAQNELYGRYSDLADTYGIPADQVVRDLRLKRAPARDDGVRPASVPDPGAASAGPKQENPYLSMSPVERATIDIEALSADERALLREALRQSLGVK